MACVLTFLLSAGRVLSQLSQYDCVASGGNSPQGVAVEQIGVLASLCWNRNIVQGLLFASGESRFYILIEASRLERSRSGGGRFRVRLSQFLRLSG